MRIHCMNTECIASASPLIHYLIQRKPLWDTYKATLMEYIVDGTQEEQARYIMMQPL